LTRTVVVAALRVDHLISFNWFLLFSSISTLLVVLIEGLCVRKCLSMSGLASSLRERLELVASPGRLGTGGDRLALQWALLFCRLATSVWWFVGANQDVLAFECVLQHLEKMEGAL
jgi:hypothetical protein